MTTIEQKTFIIDLVENVKQELLKKVREYPDNWDGVELRWLIKDKFEEIVLEGFNKNSKRKKEYKNEVLINNF